jgi:hypothetical protein
MGIPVDDHVHPHDAGTRGIAVHYQVIVLGELITSNGRTDAGRYVRRRILCVEIGLRTGGEANNQQHKNKAECYWSLADRLAEPHYPYHHENGRDPKGSLTFGVSYNP